MADDGPTAFGLARRLRRQRGRRLVKPAGPTPPLTAEQRLLLLDTWRRSGLPAADFAALVGLSRHTLYEWKRKFAAHGKKRQLPCSEKAEWLGKCSAKE